MKTIATLLLPLFAFTQLFAQGIPVSHAVEKKNVVLEFYSGIYDQYAVRGHRIAQEISDAHPGDIVPIDIETGIYSAPATGAPDYRTPYGPALANQTGLNGYPAGTVNRHLFSQWSQSTGTAMSTQYWVSAADQVLQEDASANIGVEATIDVQTRLLTVDVQVYYTGTPASSTNKLNVAILQEDIIGPQAINATQTPYPGTVLPDGQYIHRHILRELITGQFGESITPVAAGVTINKTYPYQLNDSIYQIFAELGNLRIAAFVAESNQEIINGQVITPTFTNFASANNVKVRAADIGAHPFCGSDASPEVTIQNYGSQTLTSLRIDYSVNGGTVQHYQWTGALNPLATEEVALNNITFSTQVSNTLSVNAVLPNGVPDGDVSDNSKTDVFTLAPDVDGTINMTLQLDSYGNEVTWEVVNSSGTTLYSGGPYTNSSSPAPIHQTFNLSSFDCYKLVVHDSYGDGMPPGVTITGFTLVDNNNYVIVSNLNDYGYGTEVPFSVGMPQQAAPCSGRYYDKVFSGPQITTVVSSLGRIPNLNSLPQYEVNYGFADGQNLDMYVFQPDGDVPGNPYYEPKRPLVILAFGGNFTAGFKQSPDLITLCEEFTHRGFVTASIDYRLQTTTADSVSLIEQIFKAVQDAKAAVRFFYKDAATTNTYRIDTNNIFLGGTSEGGTIGAHYGYVTNTLNTPPWVNQAISLVGGLEGNSGNAGYSSKIRGIINLAGMIVDSGLMDAGEPPMVSMHGNDDGTVPYCSDVWQVGGIPVFTADGSGSMKVRAVHEGISNPFYTWRDADHVPYVDPRPTTGGPAYMDTTIWFIRDFLYNTLTGESCGSALAAQGTVSNICGLNTTAVDVSGKIFSELGSGVRTVTVNATGSVSQTETTDLSGNYSFSLSAGDNVTLTPSKVNDVSTNNGITTLDLLLTRRHILVMQQLGSPYKIIAADVNGSGSVTSLDVTLMRALILQASSTFPNGKLWAFVPDDYVFANPQNPFPFQSSRTYSNLSSGITDADFIGMKLGDVNNSWDPNTPKAAAVGSMQVALGEYSVFAGNEIIVPVKVKDFNNITGYQFTLSWNPGVLALQEVTNKFLNGYFGEQKIKEGYLTTSWNDEMTKGISLDDDAVLFELKFKATGPDGISSEIKINSELAAAEAYNGNLDLLDIIPTNGMVKVGNFTSLNTQPSTPNPIKLSVQPNPFSNSTQITFTLHTDETISIMIYDILGKAVRHLLGNYSTGEHRIEWAADDDSGKMLNSGLYQVRMRAGNKEAGVRVELIK